MARPAERLVARPGGPRRLLSRAGGRAARQPWLLAILALPSLLVVMTVVVACMVLFVRGVSATTNSCGSGSGAAVPVAATAATTELATGSDVPGPGTPPENFIPAYFAAANQPDAQLGPEGPYMLMGIHEVESGFGRSNAEGVKSGINFADCCKGPFQFYDTSRWSTWMAHSPSSGKTYARDGDGDGDASIYSNHDAMFAAAAYLHDSGAPRDWSKAILSYNHSIAYRDQVEGRAAWFKAHVAPPGGSSAPPVDVEPVAANAGSGGDVQALAASTGCQPAAALPVASPAGSGPYGVPLSTRWVVEGFFWEPRTREDGSPYNHAGTDLAVPLGTPIYAIGDGTVTTASRMDPDGYGTYICIQHTQRVRSCYAHESAIEVRVGETVRRGQQIARVGAEGDATGPHLHFEVYYDGDAQCPADYVGADPAKWCVQGAPGYGEGPK